MGSLSALTRVQDNPDLNGCAGLLAVVAGLIAPYLGQPQTTKNYQEADAPTTINNLPHKADIGSFIGSSNSILMILEQALQVAPAKTTVLLRGESGTGKEVIAELIHRNSPRLHAPFVKVNCGALPESLIETELFGHERGAFTGAHAQR